MEKAYKFGIIIGRFQPIHIGHEDIINKTLAIADKTAIFIGSSQESGTAKNPFDYNFRKKLIEEIYSEKIKNKILEIYPLPDRGLGNNSSWGDYVLDTIYNTCGEMPDLFVTGKECRREKWFEDKNISILQMPKTIDISATKLRQNIINNDLYCDTIIGLNPKILPYYNEMKNKILTSKNNINTQSL